MIIGNVKDFKNRKFENENINKAFEYIYNVDLLSLESGKHVIDGDNVYINVMDAKAFPIEERFYEVHKNYMDIQMDLVGVERIDTGDCTKTEIEEKKEENKNVQLQSVRSDEENGYDRSPDEDD